MYHLCNFSINLNFIPPPKKKLKTNNSAGLPAACCRGEEFLAPQPCLSFFWFVGSLPRSDHRSQVVNTQQCFSANEKLSRDEKAKVSQTLAGRRLLPCTRWWPRATLSSAAPPAPCGCQALEMWLEQTEPCCEAKDLAGKKNVKYLSGNFSIDHSLKSCRMHRIKETIFK